MDETKVNLFSQMLNGITSNIDMLVTQGQKLIFEKEKFAQLTNTYVQLIGQTIQLINTPAILIKDTNDKDHYMVAGEKWKLFSALVLPINETDLRSFVVTNPFIMKADEFTTTKIKVIEAIMNYEEVYNKTIDMVMNLNLLIIKLQNQTSNGDMLNVMRESKDLLIEYKDYTNDYYKTPENDKPLN